MKIEKAIEHSNAIVESGEYLGEPDDSRAVKLGIEALKFIERGRACGFPESFELLLGETEE